MLHTRFTSNANAVRMSGAIETDDEWIEFCFSDRHVHVVDLFIFRKVRPLQPTSPCKANYLIYKKLVCSTFQPQSYV